MVGPCNENYIWRKGLSRAWRGRRLWAEHTRCRCVPVRAAVPPNTVPRHCSAPLFSPLANMQLCVRRYLANEPDPDSHLHELLVCTIAWRCTVWIRRLKGAPRATTPTPTGHPSCMMLWHGRRRLRGHLLPVCYISLTALCGTALTRRDGCRDLPHRHGHSGCQQCSIKAASRRRHPFSESVAASCSLKIGLLGVRATPSDEGDGPTTLLRAAAVHILLGRTCAACHNGSGRADWPLASARRVETTDAHAEKSYHDTDVVYARVIDPHSG